MAQDFAALAEACGVKEVTWRGTKISLQPPFKRLYLPEVWKDRCGEPIENVLEGKGFNRAGLMKLAEKLGVAAGEKTPSAKLFDRIVEAGGYITAPTGGAPDANLIPIAKTVADAAIRERIEGLSVQLVGGTPDELAAHIRKELVTWSKVAAEIKASDKIQ